jgi:hypothetical protein
LAGRGISFVNNGKYSIVKISQKVPARSLSTSLILGCSKLNLFFI